MRPNCICDHHGAAPSLEQHRYVMHTPRKTPSLNTASVHSRRKKTKAERIYGQELKLSGRQRTRMSKNYLTIGRRILVIGAMAWVATLKISTPAYASNYRIEYCAGEWMRWPYADFPLSESGNTGAWLPSSYCTIVGRTGHAAISLSEFENGIENIHVWMCDDGNGDCGVDKDFTNVDCVAEARPEDTSQGTRSDYDGTPVYEMRVPSYGAETVDWPMDENAHKIDRIEELRVVCRRMVYL